MLHERVVAHAVYLQRTSPNFAEYCVAHVTDPAHGFLYSSKDTPDRRLYLRLLDEARALERSARVRREETDAGRGPSSRSLFFCSQPPSSGEPLCLSDYDVDTLWSDMGELFALPVAAASPTLGGGAQGRPSGVRTPHAVVVVGPHAPHLFSSKASLRRFLLGLLRAAADPTEAHTDAVLSAMQGHLPLTEAGLHVAAYVGEELLLFAARRRALEAEAEAGVVRAANSLTEADARGGVVSRGDDGEEDDDDEVEGGGAVAASPVRSVKYVEGAVAVLFIAARLLTAHRDREAFLLRLSGLAAAADDAARSHRRPRGLYYQAVFDRYLSRMVEAYLRTVVAGDWGGGDSVPVEGPDAAALRGTTQFVLQTVRAWREESALQMDHAEAVVRQWESALVGFVEKCGGSSPSDECYC